MKKFSASVLLVLCSIAPAAAQTNDLVFFSDDGSKFTLIIDGDVKNAEPATRVVATGIRNESTMVMVRFEDATIPQLKKPVYMPLGKEYTIMITTNKKGERVLRPTGEAALGTAAKEEPAKPRPSTFVDDPSPRTNTQETTVVQTEPTEELQQVTTITVVDEGSGGGTTDGVNMSIGVNGVGINMNVGVTEGTGGTNTTTRTTQTVTTTTTTTGSASVKPASKPTAVVAAKPLEEPYRMPGYTGAIGCAMPLGGGEFEDLKKSLSTKSFEETKLNMAKQVVADRCLSVEQVKGIMGLFSFEASKLEFAKLAYDHTHDIGNYYKVNDAFTFESSIEELNEYIRSR
ncbi:MAG: DUF4476 domain-containing protein [Flavobacteriales bacterium]|nr:DUF4476 domain-containing protein [Flavobacteriales bacterium]